MSLHRLGSDDRLQNIRNLYGVHKSLLSKIIRTFGKVVRRYLQPIFVQTLNELQFKYLASRFEQLYDTPYIMGSIDVSYIHILMYFSYRDGNTALSNKEAI